MQGAPSLYIAMQVAEWYDTMFSKQQRSFDLQNAGQKQKGSNPGPNGQNKSTKNAKLH